MGSLDEAITRRRKQVGPLNFVQIGANDGIRDDPISGYVVREGWRGVLVEPLPDVFEQLKANYRDRLSRAWYERLVFLNAAVVAKAGPVEFYRHPFFSVCSGQALRTKMQRGVRRFMKKITVKGIEFGEVSRYARYPLDLLQIDTEGYDGEILRMLPSHILPWIIHYEHKHLALRDRADLGDFLRGRGYVVVEEETNTVAQMCG